MKNRTMSYLHTVALAVLMVMVLVPAMMFGQEQPTGERGSVEIGIRAVTGEVDGRTDLPFQPSLTRGKFNEYRDLRNGPFLRSFEANFGGVKNYFNVQSQSSLLKDQSWLATAGQYGKYKIQFRYDETPHIFTNTARTLYNQAAPGVWTMATSTRTTLGGYYSAIGTATVDKLNTALANFNSVLNSSASLVDASLIRKTGTAGLSFSPTPLMNLSFVYARERQTGLRPIGVSIQGGNAELPESIDYTTNTYKVRTDFGNQKWATRFGYQGTTFENNIPYLTVDNPLATADTASPKAAKTGRLSLYPNNRADSFDFSGSLDLTQKVHLAASIVPGWNSQNDPLLDYTTNTAIAKPTWGTLPENTANAKKQTLAMNYTASGRVLKNLQVNVSYRSYDYNNNTPIANFYPVTLDGPYATTQPTSATQNGDFGFNRKTADLTATWFFTKKNSLKVGYEFEVMDRDERDVSHTQENALITALDLNPRKDLLVRVSYRHGDRFGEPFRYDPTDPNYAVSQIIDTRRFDEAPRLQDRAEILVQYSPVQALSLSASFATNQNNYNRALGNQSPAAANPFPGMGTFYTYGLLKDISHNYTFDATYSLTNSVSLFGEYARENYNTKMALEGSIPSGTTNLINAYANSNNDVIDSWAGGMDVYFSKRVTFTTFYSLSSAKGNVRNSPINCTLSFDQCRTITGWSLDTAALPLVTMNYPETVSRLHQISALVKFKITNNLTPKFEYRFEKFDNRDFQTSVMNPYMPSMQDSSNNNWLFLGADNPGYHAHVVAASLEYHF